MRAQAPPSGGGAKCDYEKACTEIKRFRPLSTKHPAPQKEASKDDVMHICIILLPVMQICIIVDM